MPGVITNHMINLGFSRDSDNKELWHPAYIEVTLAIMLVWSGFLLFAACGFLIFFLIIWNKISEADQHIELSWNDQKGNIVLIINTDTKC